MKKYLKIVLIMLGILFTFQFFDVNYGVELKEGIENFPESYQPYLLELQKNHSNWRFIALYTNLDWEYVINNENVFGKNLVPKSYSDKWKNTNEGEYNVEVDLGWVDCSRMALQYTMDPRNFLNEVRIFQFEALSYDEKTNNLDGVEKILYGTEFYNTIVEYLTNSGENVTTSSKYSELILSAGQTAGVSSYHLASRIKQEVGPFLSHSSISGTVEGYEGLYNFYNIGATSSSEEMGAIKNGLQYAKDGKGASEAVKQKYLIPWNTKERAITGGAIFIGSSYINVGQDTLYLQKFQVVDTGSGELFWHQYMTNVLAPYSESKSIYSGYSNTGILDSSMTFIIPVYDNMSETRVENLNILDSDFDEDNTKVYANVTTTLNIRTGPSTSYEVLTQVDSSVIMTRIAKGKQSGELWDKVVLPSGIVGYAFQSYLEEVPEAKIEEIKLSVDSLIMNKGESQKINVEILPEDARDNEIEFSSSDEEVATVDTDGNILALKSGSTTITAKAKANDVSSQLKIQIYSTVTDMLLNVDDLVLQVGEQFLVTPIIFPADANNKNVVYISEDSEVAKVDDIGSIMAIKEGETKIIVTTEESSITRKIKVTVLAKLGEDEIQFEESLKVENNEITGWDIQNIKVSDVKDKISTAYSIRVYDKNGSELTDDQRIGTGSAIVIVDEDDIIKMMYHVIIYGDVNGDGKINSVDLLVLQRHILEIEKLSGVFLKAGNINRNGNNPSSIDSLLIQRHILEIQLIEQK